MEEPLRGRAVVVEVPGPGGVVLLRHRNGCCLAYARDGRTCITCPRTSMRERIRRLAQSD